MVGGFDPRRKTGKNRNARILYVVKFGLDPRRKTGKNRNIMTAAVDAEQSIPVARRGRIETPE